MPKTSKTRTSPATDSIKNSLTSPKFFPFRLRPSSLKSYAEGCQYQWYAHHILRLPSITHSRAILGNAVHTIAERFWINTSKNVKLTTEEYETVGIGYLKTHITEKSVFSAGEDLSTFFKYIKQVTPLLLFQLKKLPVPEYIEKKFYINKINLPLVSSIGGSIDYGKINGKTINLIDYKTTKAGIQKNEYILQQSFYAYLVEELSGKKVDEMSILMIIMNKEKVEIKKFNIDHDKEQAIKTVEDIIKKCMMLGQDDKKPEEIFKGNPKYVFCKSHLCALYESCPFVQKKPKKLVWEVQKKNV